jgi:hypothetical protein
MMPPPESNTVPIKKRTNAFVDGTFRNSEHTAASEECQHGQAIQDDRHESCSWLLRTLALGKIESVQNEVFQDHVLPFPGIGSQDA